jgi:hypothetical protein
MFESFDYNRFFDEAFKEIQLIRNPQPERPEKIDSQFNFLKQQEVFNYGGKDFERFNNVVNASKKISYYFLARVISSMLERYSLSHTVRFDVSIKDEHLSPIAFTILDSKSQTLYVFKETEKDNLWQTSDPPEIKAVMAEQKACFCKYVYLVYDHAFLQLINHNDDEADPGRGHNLYSLKWFWETFFGKEEYMSFEKSVKAFVQRVTEYLGYACVKSLSSNTLINFKRIIEKSILSFPYNTMVNLETDYPSIEIQFFDAKYYYLLLGTSDFSESLTSSEWLYDSIKKAKAIDLTAIAIGYFKSIEQLLYCFLSIHIDEGRKYKVNEHSSLISLTKSNLNENITIGSMAWFIKYNMDLLKDDLSLTTKEYVKEKIFQYANLRNGYTHKHNIHDWSDIEKIRSETYVVAFLVIGAFKYTEPQLRKMGRPDLSPYDDYYRLCEYVDYYSGNLFCLEKKDGLQYWCISCPDMKKEIINNTTVRYSGVYFKFFDPENKQVFGIEKTGLPKTIYLGKLTFGRDNKIEIQKQIVCKIFEDGKFIRPLVSEEKELDY